MAWTGLVAAALGMVIVDRWSRTAMVRLVLAFSAAVALHTAWDCIGTAPAYLVIGGIGLGSLTAEAHRLRRRPPTSRLRPRLTAASSRDD